MTYEDRSCKQKRRHPNKKMAKAALKGAVRTYGIHHAALMVYPCVFCQGWHVGHIRWEIENKRREQDRWAAGDSF